MNSEIYQAIAPTLPIAALLVAVISLFVSFQNRSDQREALLLAKKTELLTKIAQRQSKIGHLILVCAQKLIQLKTINGSDFESIERKRLENNLALHVQAQTDANLLIAEIEKSKPKNLEPISK